MTNPAGSGTDFPTTSPARAGLRPVLGYRDLILFYVVAVYGIRLVTVAAGFGPGVIVLWVVAFLGYCAPLALAVADLSSRFPGEGGVYIWSRRAFGDFHGFLTAWLYWTSSLVYFPSLLLFAAAQSAFVFPGYSGLAEDTSYLLTFELGALALVLALNIIGLRWAGWLHRVSAAARFAPSVLIIGLGVYVWVRMGSATDMAASQWVPRVGSLRDLFLLSTLAYLFAGFEGASTLSDEVENPRRNIPRALLASGLAIACLYIVLSLSLMVLVPASQLTALGGFADAVGAGAARLGGESLGAAAAGFSSLMLVLISIGSLSVWFATAARLPFVVGLDSYLPRAFGRVHPRFHTPWVACLALGGATTGFVLLSGLGGRVAEIYNILISLEIVIFFIPNLYLFASLLKLRNVRTAGDSVRVPGGRIGTLAAGGAGLLVTAISFIFALIPGDEVGNVALFYGSVLGSLALTLVAGAGLYVFARRRWSKESVARASQA